MPTSDVPKVAANVLVPTERAAYCSYKYAVGFFGTMHLTGPCRKETYSVLGERTRSNFACISGARDDAEEAMGRCMYCGRENVADMRGWRSN